MFKLKLSRPTIRMVNTDDGRDRIKGIDRTFHPLSFNVGETCDKVMTINAFGAEWARTRSTTASPKYQRVGV